MGESFQFEAILDGNLCKSLKDFLVNVGKSFNFPDYYGQNIDAFLECMNDLSWIDADHYHLTIVNFSHFLELETQETRTEIFQYFNKIAEEWPNVPNSPGEEEYRRKATFEVEIVA
ncbi:MAG: hypothetical protein EOO15_01585 [Chitinophagaceae bacterium]|nr:MAG: hypothetical protein EOO15_01585 [Chitinophagaceae bacterium]